MANPVVLASMLNLVIGMQNKNGFTLIEILVVVLIIGITLGFALLAFGDFGRERRIILAAEHFVNYVKFAEQQAILETSTLGILLSNNSYQLSCLHSQNHWQAMPQKSVFRQQYFPSDAVVHLDNAAKKSDNPQIIINSSGDITPFKLSFGSHENVKVAVVIGEDNGVVAMQLVKSP